MNNQYGNDYNNQYGQQPMMPQQPNMMNQPMNYNQYPNQMDPYGGMGNQQYNQKGHGGGILGVIIVLVVITGLVIFLLDYTGKIDVKGIFNKNSNSNNSSSQLVGHKPKYSDQSKKELSSLCSKVDSEGDYMYKEFNKRNDDYLDYAEKNGYVSDKSDEYRKKMFYDFKYCSDFFCRVEKDDEYEYLYYCPNGEYFVEDVAESTQHLVALMDLKRACTFDAYDENKSVENVKCSNHVCTTTYDTSKQKNYSLDCDLYAKYKHMGKYEEDERSNSSNRNNPASENSYTETILEGACANINSKGGYSDGESVICQNFVCTYTYQGTKYTKTCEH